MAGMVKYLAHPIFSRKEVRENELRYEKELGVELINPFYDGTERQDIEDIDSGKVYEYAASLDEKRIVEGDLASIDGAKDGILAVITNDKSVGTFMELMYGKLKGKNIELIIEEEAERYRGHPWLRWVADSIFDSWEQWAASHNEILPLFGNARVDEL